MKTFDEALDYVMQDKNFQEDLHSKHTAEICQSNLDIKNVLPILAVRFKLSLN